MIVNEVHDRLDQLYYATKRASTNAFIGDLAEPALDQVQPGTARGNEVNVKPLVPFQPGFHLGMFMGGVVVHDQMKLTVGRRFLVDQLQELDPLLVAMVRHALADQPSLGQFDRREQSRRAVPFGFGGNAVYFVSLLQTKR